MTADGKKTSLLVRLFSFFERIDRRIVYLFVAVSLTVPLVLNVSLKPAEMATADSFFREVSALSPQPGKIVLISADFGPGTMAENRPQAELAIEHLMRKRVPFAMFSIYTLAAPFLIKVPQQVAQRLEAETGERWIYGRDWVNLGYRPGGIVVIQGMAKAADIKEVLKTDANGTPLSSIPVMQGVKTIGDIQMLMQFTGLLGAVNSWLQYFSGPPFLYGCTSVTIPEAFIYYSSGQMKGFFEGVAGAAWYEVLLEQAYPSRSLKKSNVALRINTGLSFAHLVIIAVIILGNAGLVVHRWLGEA